MTNVYNTLGYAWLEKGDKAHAIDAFRKAIEQHPDDKAGYCDLACAYLEAGEENLAISYFRKAISVDPTAKTDICGDPRLQNLIPQILIS